MLYHADGIHVRTALTRQHELEYYRPYRSSLKYVDDEVGVDDIDDRSPVQRGKLVFTQNTLFEVFLCISALERFVLLMLLFVSGYSW